MIPFAEWSRERSINIPQVIPAEPRRLQAEFEPEEDSEELCDLAAGISQSVEQNVRIDQIVQMRGAVEADCNALMARLAETVQAEAQRQANEMMSQINSALRPWIGARIAETAVQAFVDEVERVFGQKLGAGIACHVPEALRPALAAELESRRLHPALTDSPDQELHAVLGETKVETTVSLWQEKLARLLA